MAHSEECHNDIADVIDRSWKPYWNKERECLSYMRNFKN